MNLVDCYVTKVLTEPYFKYEKWWVKVEFNSYGFCSYGTNIMFDSLDEANNVKVGYKFQS